MAFPLQQELLAAVPEIMAAIPKRPCLMLKIIDENSEIFQLNGFFNHKPLSTSSENNSKGLIDSSSIPSTTCHSSE
jgi:hypothetical protein